MPSSSSPLLAFSLCGCKSHPPHLSLLSASWQSALALRVYHAVDDDDVGVGVSEKLQRAISSDQVPSSDGISPLAGETLA